MCGETLWQLDRKGAVKPGGLNAERIRAWLCGERVSPQRAEMSGTPVEGFAHIPHRHARRDQSSRRGEPSSTFAPDVAHGGLLLAHPIQVLPVFLLAYQGLRNRCERLWLDLAT